MTAIADKLDGKVPKNETTFPICRSFDCYCYYYFFVPPI